jgi:glycosyltransferase involved in cell wall biosynthesis
MNTGGTPASSPGRTGLLSMSPAELAADVRRLRGDQALRARLGAAARLRAVERFDAASTITRIDRLYRDLTGARRT